MAGQTIYITVYDKTGQTTLLSNNFMTTQTIGDVLSYSNKGAPSLIDEGVTALSLSIGGTALSNSTSLDTMYSPLSLYDATPSTASNVIKKLIQNGTEYNLPSGTTYTAGENIEISSGVISANNVFIITEADVTVSTDDTKGVAPYNTSYGYTNIDISANAGIEWREGAIYTFVVDTEMVVASANRNVRVKIGTGAYIPVMGSSAIIAGSSYFTKANTRQYQYSTKYQSGGALHLFTDSNTTYSAMSVSEGKTGTATTSRTVRADYLKQIIDYHAGNLDASKADDNAVVKLTGNQTIAGTKTFRTSPVVPSKTSAATNTGTAIATEAQVYKKQDKLTTQTAYTSKGSDTKVPQITTNTLGQVTGITEVDITHPSQVDNTAYAANWDGVTGTAPSKNAVYDKINAMDTTISGKQDTLVSGTSIKTINNESLLGSGNITIESGPTYSAGKNISISSNTINSDSTSILTQSDYDNLPSSKNSDDKTYFICEATLLTYAEIVSMATGEGDPRTNTIAVLNSAPVDYYNMLSSGGNLTSVTLSTPSGSFPTISGISEKIGTIYRYIAYRNGTWIEGEKHNK